MKENKVIEMYLKVGNDNGNSEHDIIINRKIVRQPNVISKVRNLPLLDEINPKYVLNNIHDNLIVSINSPSVTPALYYPGNYALNSGQKVRNIEVGFDNNKYESDIIVVNTLSQIAGFAVREAFLENENLDNGEILVKVDMTTGLPVTQYSKHKSDAFTEKFTRGKHNIIVYLGNIRVNVNIVFEYVKVLPESVPTVFALQNILLESENENKELVEDIFAEFKQEYFNTDIDGNYFKKKRILHVGIGEGTTEYPLTDDIIFNPNFINGSNNGIGHAIDKAIPEFVNKVGLRSYTRQKYSEVVRDHTHKYHELALDILEDYIEEESEEILKNVINEIEKANNEIDVICVYGGGSILMKKHLKNRLKEISERANIKLFYVPEEYAVIIESLGMYEFTNSIIFEKLKEKQTNINN